MRVVLVEPHHGGSHRAWAEGYCAWSRHEVSLITHAGANWRHRLRAGAVTLAEAVGDEVAERGPVDVVLVSSPLDVAAFAGLARRVIGPEVPIVAYLHENQVRYPRPDATDTDAAWRTWTSLLAADRVAVNSSHHRDELAAGLEALLAQAPDHPQGHLLAGTVSGIEVVPVGVDLPEPPTGREPGPVRVLWNHRWDPDKNPDVFVRAIERIVAHGAEVEVILGGADHWDGGRRRAEAAARLGSTVSAVGPFDDAAYRRQLGRADVVVSVADHDYFGVAIVEAVAAGCVPVLPRALAYPELIPEAWHPAVFHAAGGFRRRLEEVVADLPAAQARVAGLAAAMTSFGWPVVAPRLDDLLARAVAGG